ncbi:MAG: hypothetical protein OXG24_10955 [Gammaproteobacteria bacterium]|nr:hypothetical protein [Gammaproteobacteria bacterium]
MQTSEYENPRTRIAQNLQPNLWPDWVRDHPWLESFLTRAEAEVRNRGDLECTHFHLILAFLRLPSPVPDWFIQLRVNAEQWKEDVLVTIGVNSKANQLNTYVGYGNRMTKARKSLDPVVDVPLDRVSAEALRMLELARKEADLDGTRIDERHFMVPMMDWHPHGEPTLEELRHLTTR